MREAATPQPRLVRSRGASFVDCQTCKSAEPFVTYVRIAISAPPSGAFWSKKDNLDTLIFP